MTNNDKAMEELINLLPDILSDALSEAQEGFGGSTVDMIRAAYGVIEVLKKTWLTLATYFPEKHFGGVSSTEFIEEFLQQRFVWRRALAEPYGAGTGGTIAGPITTGGVMDDMVNAVEQTVASLRGLGSSYEKHLEWSARWKKAQNPKKT